MTYWYGLGYFSKEAEISGLGEIYYDTNNKEVKITHLLMYPQGCTLSILLKSYSDLICIGQVHKSFETLSQ